MAKYIPPATLHRIYGDSPWTDERSYRPDPIEMLRHRFRRPTLGERLVLFFRLNGEALSFWFAMASIAVLIGAVGGAYLGAGK